MIDKDELLAHIDRSWSVLISTVEGVSEEALSSPGEVDGWTAKDHLSHLTAWERKVLAILEGREPYEGLAIEEASYRTRDVDGINELIYERTRDRLPEDVMADLRDTHARLMAAIGAAPDQKLMEPYVPQDSTDERRLVDGVTGNTYEHYDEHLPEIERLLGSR